MNFPLPNRRFYLGAIALGLMMASADAATIQVTNAGDSLAGSLRQAIQDANVGDTIVFNIPTSDPGYDSANHTWIIVLTTAELAISRDVTIDGGGKRILVQRSRLGGTPNFRIFNILAGTVTLSRFTIAFGLSQDGTGESKGGGVRNAGTLTLVGCTVSGNAGRFAGGGLYNNGTVSLANCTFNANSSDGTGGAILNEGNLTATSCTVSGNIGVGSPPGIANRGTAHLRNCVVARNTGSAFSDAYGPYISEGYNFIGRATGPAGFPELGGSGFGEPGSHDQLGTFEAPADPKLGSLQDNGGPTRTMAPSGGSPLIDQGNGFGVTTDQRGFPRPQDNPAISNAGGSDGSDIGAVEADLVQAGPTFVVTTTDEHDDGVCGNADCTLLEALNATNAAANNAATIVFNSGVAGSITTSLTPLGLAIVSPVKIIGPGARVLTISGSGVGRIFRVASSGVSISGLTLTDGETSGNSFPDNCGGAILNTGALTLTDCSLANNHSVLHGGCVCNNGQNGNASLTLVNCTLSQNQADASGGAIFNAGYNGHADLTLTSCTLDRNEAAQYGGTIYNDGTLSGNATLTLTNCTLNQNSATLIAGGIYNDALNPNSAGTATTTLRNTILRQGSAGVNLVNDTAGGGLIISQGHNLSSDAAGGDSGTGAGGFLNGGGDIRNTDPKLGSLSNNGGPTDTVALLGGSPAINAGDDALAPLKDQRGLVRNGVSDIGAFEFGGLLPVSLGNISTRGPVGIGDEVMIGGFIINGTADKTVLLRAIGPSLSNPPFNLANTLLDPTISLFGSSGMIVSNDNWADAANAQSIDPNLRPSNGLESALLVSLAPGSYTAIVRGANGGTGIGLVEVFDLDATVPSKLSNISTRGLVETGDSVMIGGFVVKGPDSDKVVIRAIGPSLANPPFNLTNVLQNPSLFLFDANGMNFASNDDWRSSQTDVIATGLQPTNDAESAIVVTLVPGNYTAIVRGVSGTTGVALVEVYGLN